MGLVSALGAIFSGGVTGVIGSVTTAVATYKMKQLEFKHDESIMDKKKELLVLENENKIKMGEIARDQAKIQTDGQIKQTQLNQDGQIKLKSYDLDKATYVSTLSNIDFSKFGTLGKIAGGIAVFLLGVVDFMRGIIRPASTIYFEVFMFMIWFSIFKIVKGFHALDSAKVLDLFYMITMLILYCGTTCVLWWFGSRQIDKHFNKHKLN